MHWIVFSGPAEATHCASVTTGTGPSLQSFIILLAMTVYFLVDHWCKSVTSTKVWKMEALEEKYYACFSWICSLGSTALFMSLCRKELKYWKNSALFFLLSYHFAPFYLCCKWLADPSLRIPRLPFPSQVFPCKVILVVFNLLMGLVHSNTRYALFPIGQALSFSMFHFFPSLMVKVVRFLDRSCCWLW